MTRNAYQVTFNQKNFFYIVVAIILLIGLLSIILLPNKVSASDQTGMKHFKYVTIESGDSLWSYANDNMDDNYETITDYINEVKSINHMDNDTIISGEVIVLPYYIKQ